MLRKALAHVLLVAAAASLGLGCERVRQVLDKITGTPRAGAECTSYSGECVGPNEALICIDGKYVRRSCEHGCTSTARDVDCVAGEGQRCAREEEGTGNCDPRGGAMLICEGGVVRKQPCRGADKCKTNATGVECDGTIGIKGEKCSKGAIACAADGTEQLRCEAGVYVSSYPCRGPKACTVGEDVFDCDRSVVVDGDPCEPKDEGSGACSMDGQRRLDCAGGKFVETYQCRGPKKCSATDDDVSCDTSVGAPGDTCHGEGTGACSEDRNGLLVCKSGKLVLDSKCSSCESKDGEIICH